MMGLRPKGIVVLLLMGAAVATLVLVAPGDAAPETDKPDAMAKVDFVRDIRPILSENCFLCHGPDSDDRRAGLRLDTREGAFGKRDGHAVVVPGDSGKSELYRRIMGKQGKMPPRSSGKSLTSAQIALLKRWIDEGAHFQQHWAFVAPKRPDLPGVKNKAWPRNGIDYFVLARLEKEGLKPSSEANRARLIRRVTLDLIGLPPTPEEVRAFVEDSSPDAYEKVVDRLLASPRFGEHMAQSWLDAARYADTNGYQNDRTRNMWPWRDWVIDALNKNMPFDQFTIEQLAGDLLPRATTEQLVATGFNRNHRINEEGGVIPEEFRVEYVVDRVDTTSTVWMGMTMGCARCHDHKYDPFSQKEYYQLFAYFNSIAERGLDGGKGNADPQIAILSPESERRMHAIDAEIASKQPALATFEKQVANAQETWETGLVKKASRKWEVLAIKSPNVPAFAHEDGSVEFKEVQDILELQSATALPRLRSLRIEVMPASGAAKVDDFVLSHFEVKSTPHAGSPKAGVLPVAHVSATIEKAGFPAIAAIYPQATTGWSVPSGTKSAHIEFSFGQTAKNVGWIGNPLRDGSQDSASQLINLYLKSAFAGPGTVDKVRSFTKAVAGAPFGVYLLRPDGADNYQVVRRHDFKASGEKRGTMEITLPEPWPVRAGDVFAHSGNGGPTFVTDAKTADAIFYPLSAFPKQGARLDTTKIRRFRPSRDYAMQVHFTPLVPAEKTGSLEWGPKGAGLTITFEQKHPSAKGKMARIRVLATEEDVPQLLASLPQPIQNILRVERSRRSPTQKGELLEYFRKAHADRLPKELVVLQNQVDALMKEKAKLSKSKVTTMVMRELPKARDTFVLLRGQYDRRGDKVEPGIPAGLPPLLAGVPNNRLGFAKWLSSPRHPLTARVTVNRYWQHFFGLGLVRTAEDFGSQGALPSHPQLLDWLATEFVRSGWDVKAMQKQIVMSATYRQSSRVTPVLRERDPENRLLARGPRLRLSAQVIRDQALAASGLLVNKLGGPPVRPYQAPNLWREVGATAGTYVQDKGEKLYRRSIYTFWKRTVPPPSMTVLDASEREICSVRRPRTNTPLAALTLMNHATFVEAARHLAERALIEGGTTPEERLSRAMLLVLSREPDAEELKILIGGLNHYRARFAKAPTEAAKLLSVGESPRNQKLEVVEHAAYTAVANLILNLDEAITKE